MTPGHFVRYYMTQGMSQVLVQGTMGTPAGLAALITVPILNVVWESKLEAKVPSCLLQTQRSCMNTSLTQVHKGAETKSQSLPSFCRNTQPSSGITNMPRCHPSGDGHELETTHTQSTEQPVLAQHPPLRRH
jgi:hypothetical protein